jgi:hypothetical protein
MIREIRERQVAQELQLRAAINDATERISGALASLQEDADRRARERAQRRELAQHLDSLQRTVNLLQSTLPADPQRAPAEQNGGGANGAHSAAKWRV